MLSKHCEKTTSNCAFRYITVCLDPNVPPKMCPAGDQGICSKCGHSLPFVIEAIENARLAVRRLSDAINSDNRHGGFKGKN